MLTDIALKALKPGSRPYKRAEGGGLSILVQTDGKKFWRLAYRFAGKQKALSGGRYPTIGLKAARAWRDPAKAQLALGRDPSVERRADKELLRTKISNSFEEIAREWAEARQLGRSPRSAALVIGRLEADIFPTLGAMEISAITPRLILDAVRKIEARGAVEMAYA